MEYIQRQLNAHLSPSYYTSGARVLIFYHNLLIMIFPSLFPNVPLSERAIADELLELIWKHGSENPKKSAFVIGQFLLQKLICSNLDSSRNR
jgi:hypothetical protein